MKIIVLIGETKSGKTTALRLLKEVNDGTIEYFQEEIKVSDLLELTLRDEKLGVVETNDKRVLGKVDSNNVFIISRTRATMIPDELRFFVSPFLDQSKKLDWTEAFKWLKSNSSEEKPLIADKFFNFVCKP